MLGLERQSSFNHTVTAISCSGPPLLQLPREVLQLISRHLTAPEWSRGPCLACRHLCNLELPRIELYPATDVPGMEHIEARLPTDMFPRHALLWHVHHFFGKLQG